MSEIHIPDEQWSKIYEFVKTCPGSYAGQEAACRKFVEAVLWITRSGAQWRLLPKEYGRWNSVYKRFARRCDNGVRVRMHQHFADNPDMEHLLINSTIVRAHPSATGALKKTVDQANAKPSEIFV